MNCKHFFTDSGTYHLFLSVLHGYFFMTFINITFGYQFHYHGPKWAKPSQLGSPKIGPFHLNDLKCFKSPACSVFFFVASPKYVPGEKNWRNDLCNCIFGSVFWKILKFFCKLGCWLLNCMCKWDTISGMFGCIWIFRNIFTGNLFLAKKVSPVSRSCEGHMLQVLRGKDTHPTTKSMDVMDVHVKQVYTSWIWYY